MRCVLAALLAVGCGRVAFDPRTGDGSVVNDDAELDGAPDDVAMLVDAGLPSGLVAWYPFEGPGIMVVDEVGDRDGLCPIQECPTATAGHRGQGLLFNGTDDCVAIPDDGTFEPPQLTIAIWARQDSAGTQSQVSKRVIGGSVNSWQLETDPLGGDPMALSFTTYDGSGMNVYAITPVNALVVGQWHHLAVTFDGSVKRVYIDGAQKTFVTGHPALPYDGMSVRLGCDDNGVNARHFNGALDDFQFYNRALSAAEIADVASR